MNHRALYRSTFSRLHTSPDFHVEASTNMTMMNGKKMIGSVLIAAVLVAALTCAAVAAVRMLTAPEAASAVGDAALAAALAGEDAIVLDESQTCGDYTVDLLSIVSGAAISDFVLDGDLDEERSYLVAALRYTDGTPITVAGEFGLLLTPLVEGYDPVEVNVFTLGGSRCSFVRNGVEYVILDCSSLEPYADHTVYLAAYEGFAPAREIIAYGEDGSIAFAESYTGPQALFEIPMKR